MKVLGQQSTSKTRSKMQQQSQAPVCYLEILRTHITWLNGRSTPLKREVVSSQQVCHAGGQCICFGDNIS